MDTPLGRNLSLPFAGGESMNPESAKTLAWTAGLLLLLGLIILSPTGAFALLVLAALCAAIPAVFGSKRPRVISLILLIASLGVAAGFYPAFKRDRAVYLNRGKEQEAKPPAPNLPNPEPKK